MKNPILTSTLRVLAQSSSASIYFEAEIWTLVPSDLYIKIHQIDYLQEKNNSIKQLNINKYFIVINIFLFFIL